MPYYVQPSSVCCLKGPLDRDKAIQKAIQAVLRWAGGRAGSQVGTWQAGQASRSTGSQAGCRAGNWAGGQPPLSSTFWREKQLPAMVQAWGERRSQASASCARCASSTSRFKCHSTVLYTSSPCATSAATSPPAQTPPSPRSALGPQGAEELAPLLGSSSLAQTPWRGSTHNLLPAVTEQNLSP